MYYSREVLNRCLVLSFLVFIIFNVVHAMKRNSSLKRKLLVEECPKMNIMKNVTKVKLLGFWYAYATTPLPFERYDRKCSSYNVKSSPYFKTNILYTNYKSLVITYSCLFNPAEGLYAIKLRMLTRTRTPMAETIREAIEFMTKVDFPIETLNWLKSEAFCFEWYQLKFETELRPIHFQAPFYWHDERR